MASRDRDDHATRGREFSPRESEPRAFVSAADRGNLVTGGLASLSFDDRFSRGEERRMGLGCGETTKPPIPPFSLSACVEFHCGDVG